VGAGVCGDFAPPGAEADTGATVGAGADADV